MAETGANGQDSELTPRQRRAIAHLVAAPTREAGCKLANVGRSTLTAWLAQPAFTLALREAEDAAYRESLVAVQRLGARAVEALEGLLASEIESIRLRAAVEVLGFALKARDQVEIEERLAALEARTTERRG